MRTSICAALAVLGVLGAAAPASAKEIRNKQFSNYCLADKTGVNNPGVIWQCNGNSDQNWKEGPAHSGFSLTNAAAPDLCFGPYTYPGTPGAFLFMMQCYYEWVKLDAGDGCYWYATNASYAQWLGSGGMAPLMVLGVAGAANGQTTPPTKLVILWTWDGQENQKWCPR